MRRALSALPGPLAVLVALVWLGGRADPGGVEAGDPERLDAQLAAPADTLILGPSYARTNLEPRTLGRALGGSASALALPHAVSSHLWALTLRDPTPPRTLVLVGSLQSLLAADPLTDTSALALEQLRARPDPVLDPVVPPRAAAWVQASRARLGLRLSALSLVKSGSLAVARALGLPPDAAPELGDGTAERSPDALRRDAATKQVRPAALTAARSLVPALVARATAAGTTVLVVRTPISPLVPAALGDVADPAEAQAFVEAIRAAGGRWIDLSAFPMPAWQFANADHLRPEGAVRLTRAVVAALAPGAALVGGVTQVDDHTVPVPLDVTFAAPPRALSRRVLPTPAPGGVLLPAPELAPLSDLATRAFSPFSGRCSPLMAVGDDGPIGPRRGAAIDLPRTGGAVHGPPGVLVAGPARGLALDPDRRCDAGLWLYPGDQGTIHVEPSETPIRQLTLRLRQALPGPPVRVRAQAAGLTRLDAQAGAGEQTFDLELPAGVPWTLTLEAAGGFWFVSRAAVGP